MSATDPLASARNLWARHSWGDEGEGVPVAAETQNGSSHPAVTEDGQGLTRGCIVSFIDNRACEVRATTPKVTILNFKYQQLVPAHPLTVQMAVGWLRRL